jgi:hypothetical protein
LWANNLNHEWLSVHFIIPHEGWFTIEASSVGLTALEEVMGCYRWLKAIVGERLKGNFNEFFSVPHHKF